MAEIDMTALYDEFLDDRGHVSEEVTSSYKAMQEAFDNYLAAVDEDTFRQAFRFGYERGFAAAQKGR